MSRNTAEQTTILVVDDENEFKGVLQEVFEMSGYTCLTASNGQEALQIMQKQKVHLVLTDIVMPIMDGIQLTEVIKKKYRCQVLMMTGYVKDFTPAQAKAKGASDLIHKPLNIQELLKRVQNLLRKSS